MRVVIYRCDNVRCRKELQPKEIIHAYVGGIGKPTKHMELCEECYQKLMKWGERGGSKSSTAE